ncbi:MAG: hypothetical protein M1817_006554 [Caeruleum heppii]|nr:MAG: hypothetical protein M1817_006554 [Caeruleum heppii]
MDEEDDEAFQRQIQQAMAASLADQANADASATRNPALSPPVVDLSSTEDESEVQVVAVTARKDATVEVVPSVDARSLPLDDQTSASAAVQSGFLGLDRKAMEAERQARLKRKRSISPPRLRRNGRIGGRSPNSVENANTSPSAGDDVVPVSERSTLCAPFTRDATSASSPTPETKQDPQSATATPLPSTAPGVQYRHGVVRKTWTFGFPRKDDIKIEEVLQKEDLKVAVLSAFQWDLAWLLRKIDMNKTKLVLAMQAKEEATKAQYRAETASMPNLRLCFPSMAGNVNCMHSKLQLLFHEDYLRVVVPSANLTDYDWGESGVMENMVFLIDLPRLPSHRASPTANRERLSFFGRELLYFLEAMGLERDVVEGVLNFDFSETNHIASGGSHAGESWRRTGYCGLGATVRQLGLQNDGPVEVEFVTSSVGSLNDQFLQTMYLAAQGDDGMTEYKWRNPEPSQGRRKKGAGVESESEKAQKRLSEEMKKTFRIYFPTSETVERSRGGPACGGTICFQSRWYDGPNFPRALLRDCQSQREGMLMHNKMLFARSHYPRNPKKPPSQGWAYTGSANLSESAWGRLVKDKTTKAPKLNCRNWECGVLIPIRGAAPDRLPGESGGTSVAKMDCFEGKVPVPMRVPGAEYGARRPWFYARVDS